MRIPVTPNLKIEEFLGGQIVTYESVAKNAIFEKDSQGVWSLTQRPAVNVSQDPSDESVTAVRGRGVYDWSAVNAEYFVNDNEVYKGTYATTVREAGLTLTSLTSSSTTATATYTAHGYLAGDTVVISGADQAEYNGTYTIASVPTADTFTYTFAGSATTPATGTIVARRSFTTGTDRVYFFEVGDYLVILDPENSEGWYIASGTSTVLHKITDADFPSNQTPAYSLAKGGFVLNDTLYVPTTAGTLHGCDTSDPTAWDALNVISAEFEPDGGVLAFKHNQYGVFLGPRTCEFFQDAGNPTGSPLSSITHIQHSVGAANMDSSWESGGVNYFLGQSSTGEISAYMMAGMQLKKVSTTDIDSYLTATINSEGKTVVCSGVSIGGRVFYSITTYHLYDSEPEAIQSLVYDAAHDIWGPWDLMQVDHWPLVDWTKATRTEIGKGILLDGKIVTMSDDYIPNDRVDQTGWVESGWVEPGWVTESSTEGTPIRVEVITGLTDMGTMNRKFVSSYRLACSYSGTGDDVNPYVSLSWSNDTNRDYGTARDLDPLNPGQRASRCGSFRWRNHKLVFALNRRVVMRGVDIEVEAGNA